MVRAEGSANPSHSIGRVKVMVRVRVRDRVCMLRSRNVCYIIIRLSVSLV